MAISRFFESLGARLTNIRQSWGATHRTDKAVYLRVWQEDQKVLQGQNVVRLLLPPNLHGGSVTAHGYTQRQRHIGKILRSYDCFCVVAWGRDSGGIKGLPRSLPSNRR